MKHYILILSLLITMDGMAQNGGQYPENSSVKLEYIGGAKVVVSNKQSCTSVIRLNDSQTEGDITIAGNSSFIYILPANLTTNIRVKAKSTTNCGSTDFGWVELYLSALPLKFVGFDLTNDYGTLCTAKFTVADVVNVKQFYILVSTDGITWVKKDSVKTIPNGTIYSSVLNLK
jgi:hypothetical protein